MQRNISTSCTETGIPGHLSASWLLARLAVCAMVLSAGLSMLAADEALRAKIDVAHPTHAVPKTLYGIFFEDINYAADGGIYPELVANRGFDWQTQNLDAWKADNRGDAMARLTRQYGRPLNEATAAHLRIDCFGPGEGCGVRNDGYLGIAVQAGKKYDLSFYARGLEGYKGGIRVVLEDAKGNLLSSYTVKNADLSVAAASDKGFTPALPDWKRYTAVMAPSATARDAHLSILMDAAGTIELEQVSLFPQDTFNGRKNGLRKDLVQLLKDLKPGIMRFPGGCLTEGRDFSLWYDWTLSVGDGSLESRPTVWNTWGYWQSRGLGFFEYFCLCEDLGCEPLPVLGSGMTCQFAKPDDLAPMSSMGYFADNACNLIEFANGAIGTKWGALRAKMGHPAPFNLKYLGIGNENWDKIFTDRFLAIAKLVRERHPEIRIVSSSGAGADGRVFNHAWKVLNPSVNADVIDEHYYVKPDWALNAATRYDKRSRAGSKVYAGEYAVHMPDRANNLYAALCEAALMTGFERNCDLVEMTSYAPLFCKIGGTQWKTDLIWFDNVSSFGTPSYYVQKLYMNNLPTKVVPVEAHAPVPPVAGPIALQTWHTAVEFRDVAVTGKDGKPLATGLDQLGAWTKGAGKWDCADGVLSQTDAAIANTALMVGDTSWRDYTVTFKFRKTAGDEGCIVTLRNAGGHAVRLNLGGWNNTQNALEAPQGKAVAGTECPGHVDNDRWYTVKVTLEGDRLSAWLDGEQIYNAVSVPSVGTPGAFVTAGVDEAAGELVIKCVNVTATALPALFDFGSTSLPAQKARRIVLSGAPGAVNDIDHPERIAPVEDTAAFPGGTRWETALAPSSMTVLRLRLR